MIKTEVRHLGCGKVMAYLLNGATLRNMGSRDFERLNGSHPATGSIFSEKCPHCNVSITNLGELWYTEHSFVYVMDTNK